MNKVLTLLCAFFITLLTLSPAWAENTPADPQEVKKALEQICKNQGKELYGSLCCKKSDNACMCRAIGRTWFDAEQQCCKQGEEPMIFDKNADGGYLYACCPKGRYVDSNGHCCKEDEWRSVTGNKLPSGWREYVCCPADPITQDADSNGTCCESGWASWDKNDKKTCCKKGEWAPNTGNRTVSNELERVCCSLDPTTHDVDSNGTCCEYGWTSLDKNDKKTCCAEGEDYAYTGNLTASGQKESVCCRIGHDADSNGTCCEFGPAGRDKNDKKTCCAEGEKTYFTGDKTALNEDEKVCCAEGKFSEKEKSCCKVLAEDGKCCPSDRLYFQGGQYQCCPDGERFITATENAPVDPIRRMAELMEDGIMDPSAAYAMAMAEANAESEGGKCCRPDDNACFCEVRPLRCICSAERPVLCNKKTGVCQPIPTANASM